MALRAAKANEDEMQPVWGQRFGAAAELPLGSELYANAGNASDLVAGAYTNRVFNGVSTALRATKMNEYAGAEHHETGNTGDQQYLRKCPGGDDVKLRTGRKLGRRPKPIRFGVPKVRGDSLPRLAL